MIKGTFYKIYPGIDKSSLFFKNINLGDLNDFYYILALSVKIV